METNNEIKEEIKTGEEKEAGCKCGIFKCACSCSPETKKKVRIAIGIVLIVILGGLAYLKKTKPDMFTLPIGTKAAQTKVVDFIQNNLVQPGTKIDVKSVTEEKGLYKVVLNISGQEITSYLTKDGTVFFPESMDIAQIEKQAQDSQQQAQAEAAPAKEIPKTNLPEVKLFVMSYCPFGTQMEKGILPVIAALGNKIKYSLEFVNYSMHGDKEIVENLRQYCIEKNQPTKLSAYLGCFLKTGTGSENSCMTSAGINSAQVASCVAQTDTQFNVTKDAADKTKWVSGTYPPFNVENADNVKYSVQGSPTLIINGVEAQVASRDSASILKTICGAFNNAPKECSTQLPTAQPAAGFGDGTAAAGTAPASCATPATPAQ